jgi:hypothetical protein
MPARTPLDKALNSKASFLPHELPAIVLAGVLRYKYIMLTWPQPEYVPWYLARDPLL